MTKNSPLISIGLPIFNEEKHLAETLESLLGQTLTNFEIVIGDNASTDTTSQIARKFAEKDSRIHYSRNPGNVGSINNATDIFNRTRGKYFLPAAGHDLWAPTFLEKCVAQMEENDSIILTYPLSQSVDEDGNLLKPFPPQIDTCELPPEKRLLKILQQGDCYYVYGLYRRNAIAKIMPFRQSLGPDVLILAELSLLGEFAYVPEPLFHMRQTHDTAHLKSHLGKLNFRVGPLRSPMLCWSIFGNLFDIIRKRCPSWAIRQHLYPRAALAIWRKWHRLLIAIMIAGVSPRLLDWIQRKRGKAAAIEEN